MNSSPASRAITLALLSALLKARAEPCDDPACEACAPERAAGLAPTDALTDAPLHPKSVAAAMRRLSKMKFHPPIAGDIGQCLSHIRHLEDQLLSAQAPARDPLAGTLGTYADTRDLKETSASGGSSDSTPPRVTAADVIAEIVAEAYFTAADGVAGAGPVVAYEFYSRSTGHAIAAYGEHTHVGHLSAEKGYESRQLVHKPSPSPPLSLLTFCVLTLRNGYTVTGQSAFVSPDLFDAAVGKSLARRDAEQKVWPLLGFRLADRLAAKAAP